LGCESAENWQLSSTSTIAIVIIIQHVGWYSFYRPTKGGRLSRPKHCSKGVHSPCSRLYITAAVRDKHNFQRRDSNLDPLTLQSDSLTTGYWDRHMAKMITSKVSEWINEWMDAFMCSTVQHDLDSPTFLGCQLIVIVQPRAASH